VPEIPSVGVLHRVRPDDPRAAVLLQDLEREYDDRYGDLSSGMASAEMTRYPAERFLPPEGAFVLLEVDDAIVAGGAFMRYDATTAEFKRIWTAPEHRRRGHSRAVLRALEAEAAALGYARAYLTTGPRQPEAQRLYEATGWTELPPIPIGRGLVAHAYEKALDGAAAG